MDKLELRNSTMIINNYNLGENPSIEYNFKIYDPITHSVSFLGLYYDNINRRLYLPRGIDIDFVLNKLNSKRECEDIYDYYFTKHSKYKKINNIKIFNYPKDYRQSEALKFMLCLDNYSINEKRSQFSLNLPTGAGKTYCGVATIALSGIRSIIITSQTGIINQWKDSIFKFTNLRESDICIIQGSSMINRMIDGKSKFCNKSIYLVTHSTLRSFSEQYGWESLGILFDTLGIGIKIIDEAHQNFLNMTMIDFFTNVYRTYYMTATPNRSNKDEDRVYNLYMKNIPSIDLFDKDNDPHTRYIAIRYNSRPKYTDIIAISNNMYGLDRNKYIKYLMTNNNFWVMFDHIFNMIEKDGGKALFYVGINEAIITVKNHIIDLYPEYKNDIGIYTSISENKVVEREKRFILSTTKSAGAGEDIKGLKYSVVLAEPFKSEVIAKQTLGRTRDDNTYYIELVDIGIKQVNKYYNSKKEVFKLYALSTKQIDVPDNGMNDIINRTTNDRQSRYNRVVSNDYSTHNNVIEECYDDGIECITFIK